MIGTVLLAALALVAVAVGTTRAEGSYAPTIGGYLYTEFKASGDDFADRTFDIHYLAVYFVGQVHPKIFYYGEFELEHGGKGDNVFVEQAYLDFHVHRFAAIKIGAILTPFNRFDDFHEPLSNHLVTRPDVAREIGVSAWKDVGVDVYGLTAVTPALSLGYDLYLINGLGNSAPGNIRGSRQYRDNNASKTIGGRLEAVLMNRISLGASVSTGKWDEDDNYNLTMFGAHLRAVLGAAEFYGEFDSFVQEPDTTATEDIKGSGFFAQLSYAVTPQLRPTVRFGQLSDWKDRDQLALGLTYYPASSVAIKGEYDLRSGDKKNDEIWLQTAVKW